MQRRLAAVQQLLRRQQLVHEHHIQTLRDHHKQPAAELVENAESIRLTVDLPGVLPGDLRVSTENGVLSISAVRKHTSIDGTDSTSLTERNICRDYAVNSHVVDMERMETKLEHGVLTITAPKKTGREDQPVICGPSPDKSSKLTVPPTSSSPTPAPPAAVSPREEGGKADRALSQVSDTTTDSSRSTSSGEIFGHAERRSSKRLHHAICD